MLTALIVFSLASAVFGLYAWLSRRHARIAVGGALTLAVFLFVVPLLFMAGNIPFLDDYGGIIDYLSHPIGWRFEHLLDFWHEHRIAFPRLVFQLAGWLFGTKCVAGCLVLGNAIYLLLMGLLLAISRDRLLFMPFAWLFLDLIHYENTTWAFASVQNHSVLMWAVLSCWFFARAGSWRCLTGALLSATFCTFSSASGIAVWGALCAMAVKRWLCRSDEQDNHSFGWTGVRVAVFLLAMAANCAVFFNGYFAAASAHAAALRESAGPSVHPVLDALDYCISFSGAIVPVHGVAFVVGLLVAVGTTYVMLNMKRIKNDVFWGLMLFGWATAIGGAISRSEPSHAAALACRYESASLLLCFSVVFLVNGLVANHKVRVSFAMVFTYLAIMVNFAALGFGFPRRMAWALKAEQSIAQWPDGDFDLSITSDDPHEAERILRLGIARGVYGF